jgi:hypothetical protein
MRGSNMDELQFINTLCESKMFRTKQVVADLKVDDAAELAFVYFMILNVWNKDYEFAPLAKEYAQRTTMFSNFNTFRTSATDLYISLNRLIGTDQTYSDEKDEIAIKRIHIKHLDIKRYLAHIANSNNDPSFENTMLMKFQRDLNIQDSMLRSMRRLVADWDNISQSQRALVVTRLTQYIKLRAIRSDAYSPLLAFQSHKGYKVDDSNDTKKNVWDSPIATVAKGIAMVYGAKKLGQYLGKTGLDSAGSEIPSRFPSKSK